MKPVWAIGLLALSGCNTTTMETQRKEPRMQFTSAKSADAIEECLALGLSPLSSPATIRGEGKRIMTWGIRSNLFGSATISETSPTTIDVRWNGVFNKKWRNRFRSCA